MIEIQIVTEYVINISSAFIYEDLSYKELIHLCSSAKQTIEHYFIKNNNDYDLI
ncbi:hypothetical protein [Chryseobacterium sp. LAM-KRS1]|uniref:hypothetical protein n=1 Tax=Chryseobacterium sp. LAM-KRS1 TaxID=2715754 RepID=UPI00155463AE|nr:hypothetical protein [Chryseobacterium sp. LAM-KRS1]